MNLILRGDSYLVNSWETASQQARDTLWRRGWLCAASLDFHSQFNHYTR